MEDFLRQIFSATTADLVSFFIKAFAVAFAFIYLLYAVIITRQTQIMNSTFTTRLSSLIFLVSLIQIIFAVILILVALFII